MTQIGPLRKVIITPDPVEIPDYPEQVPEKPEKIPQPEPVACP